MTKAMGIDSLSIEKGKIKPMQVIVGMAVYVEDYEKFAESYSKTINTIFLKLGISPEKKIYCNYDFTKLYNIHSRPVHAMFYYEIIKHIDKLHICFTDIRETATMNVYGLKSKQEQLKLSSPEIEGRDILNKISHYFPLISLWKLHGWIGQDKPEIFVDGVTAPNFEAFRSIKDTKLRIYYSGDKCNPLIATADILLKFMELELNKKKQRYNIDGIKNSITMPYGKVFIYEVDKRDFRSISPLSKNLNLANYVKHPLVFVLNEVTKYNKIKDLENNPELGYPLFDFANKVGGGLKYYNPQEDGSIIGKTDYLIYFSEEGKKSAESLKRAVGVQIKAFEEIKIGSE